MRKFSSEKIEDGPPVVKWRTMDEKIKALSVFFRGLEVAPAIGGKNGRGAIEIVEEVKSTSFIPPQPVGFKTDQYDPPLLLPFCMFWKTLFKFGDKTVVVHTSRRTNKKVLVVLGDRATIFVEQYYIMLTRLILPVILICLLIAASFTFVDADSFAKQSTSVKELIFFFYPDHVVFWNLFSLMVTFSAIASFLYNQHGQPLIRSGIVTSLQHLSNISGFHFMVSYNWDSKDLALSLGSAIAQLPLNVWMDIYRLENAHLLQATDSRLTLAGVGSIGFSIELNH